MTQKKRPVKRELRNSQIINYTEDLDLEHALNRNEDLELRVTNKQKTFQDFLDMNNYNTRKTGYFKDDED